MKRIHGIATILTAALILSHGPDILALDFNHTSQVISCPTTSVQAGMGFTLSWSASGSPSIQETEVRCVIPDVWGVDPGDPDAWVFPASADTWSTSTQWTWSGTTIVGRSMKTSKGTNPLTDGVMIVAPSDAGGRTIYVSVRTLNSAGEVVFSGERMVEVFNPPSAASSVFWIGTDVGPDGVVQTPTPTFGDGSTESVPLDGRGFNLNTRIQEKTGSTRASVDIQFNLKPGTYYTPGLTFFGPLTTSDHSVNAVTGARAGVRVRICGASMNDTRIVFMDNSQYEQVTAADGQTVIRAKVSTVIRSSDDSFLDEFVLANLTIDCNWPNQPFTSATFPPTGPSNLDHKRYKINGICVQCLNGFVESVRVTNFGAQDDWQTGSGMEAFPIALNTFSATRNGVEAAHHVQVRRCEVSNFSGVSLGYAMGISVVTALQEAPAPFSDAVPAALNARGMSSLRFTSKWVSAPGATAQIASVGGRNLRAGLMAENKVLGNHAKVMNGFGTASSESVALVGNCVIGCTDGFNSDFKPNNRIFRSVRPLTAPPKASYRASYCFAKWSRRRIPSRACLSRTSAEPDVIAASEERRKRMLSRVPERWRPPASAFQWIPASRKGGAECDAGKG